METLASGNSAPADADNTAPVETAEPDGGAVETTGEGTAPSGTEAPSPGKETAQPRDKVQERIDTLTREKYDALRERDRTTYELERLNQRLAELEKAPAPEVAPQNDFPTLEQFGYDEGKFQSAISAHMQKLIREHGAAAAREILVEERAKADAEATYKSWATKEAEFIKSKPDYVDKVKNAPSIPISQEMQASMMRMEDGPQLAYYLVENRETAQAIMRLPPLEQAIEIGRIRERLAAQKVAAKPAVSQAPPPPAKVDDASNTAVVSVTDASSDSLSDAEWTRRRNAQIAKRNRG